MHHKIVVKKCLIFFCCVVFFAFMWLHIQRNFVYHLHFNMSGVQNEQPKYILLWTNRQVAPFPMFGIGKNSFIKNACPVQNCYVTENRHYFGESLKKFDAILFNGRQLFRWHNLSDAPKQRYPHQKYVFVMSESAFRFPICAPIFDNFFNWTFTYRLDSDCILRYFTVTNMKGEVIGPKIDMKWIPENQMNEVNATVLNKVKRKSRTAAWFVSNCITKSHRENYYMVLEDELSRFGLTIDVYGKCRNLKCPMSKAARCNAMLQRDYFFYLAFEDSFSEDYVSEKIIRAMNHYTVPIVYGAADYSFFLPPGSYLKADNPTTLAKTIRDTIKKPDLYKQFFKWTSYYKFQNDEKFSHSICEFCKMLNGKGEVKEPVVYDDFRWWWNRFYESRCSLPSNNAKVRQKLKLSTPE